MAQEPLRPAPAPQTYESDRGNAVRVIRDPAPETYRQSESFRPLDRSQHVVTIQETPVRLEQNENIVIIDDTPGDGSSLRIGERVDVTGMPTP